MLALPQPAPARARRLEAGKRWARLAQARAASRPGLCATTHVAHLEFLRETGLMLRCAGKAGNPFQTMRGNRLSCRDHPEDLPNPGTEPMSLMSPPLAGGFFTTSTAWKSPILLLVTCVLCVLVVQSCPTLCDPIEGSPPGPAVPGFSRQEHWSGLPFPPPMHESEK